MRLLIDEDVPRAITDFLRSRGHDVVHVLDVLTPGTPDHAVAGYAEGDDRIIVTFNLRDYNRLIRRGFVGRKGGLIGFIQCHHVDGLQRTKDLIDVIEDEHACLAARDATEDRRLIVQIKKTKLEILR